MATTNIYVRDLVRLDQERQEAIAEIPGGASLGRAARQSRSISTTTSPERLGRVGSNSPIPRGLFRTLQDFPGDGPRTPGPTPGRGG